MERILIIDDNEQNRELLELILEDEGYVTKKLSSPGELEKVLSDFSPNVLLMDVMMGNFNGIEVCHQIKCNPTYSNLKVILLTASNAFLKLDGSWLPADGYIAKPYDINQVTSMVAELLQERH